MNKKLIRLTESDLHRIVKESVKKVLKEELYYSTNKDIPTTMSSIKNNFIYDINGQEVEVIDKIGLDDSYLEHIIDKSLDLTFDFIHFADKLTIEVLKPSKGSGVYKADFEVFVTGKSETDERGNGYFGYPMSYDDFKDEN